VILKKIGRPRKLTPEVLCIIDELVSKFPDYYIDEYLQKFYELSGIMLSMTTFMRAFKQLHISRKKLSKRAAESRSEDQSAFVAAASKFSTEQLVFLDETHYDRRSSQRKFGWGRKGNRVYQRGYFFRGKKYSSVGAIHTTGIVACDTIESGYNG